MNAECRVELDARKGVVILYVTTANGKEWERHEYNARQCRIIGNAMLEGATLLEGNAGRARGGN